MAGTIREQSSRKNDQTVRLVYRVLRCDRLLEAPVGPFAWHDATLGIGRGDKLALQQGRLVLDDGRVSSQHAELTASGSKVTVKDLGSSNGTWVNGEKIGSQSVELPEGALLEVGRTLLTWRTAPAPLASQLVGSGVTFGTLRSYSPAFGEVLLQAQRAAKTKEPVLLLGETGAGKDVLARAIHSQSGRKGPFVPIDAGAIPDSLFESTLFGHEKGAFTGANEQRTGELVRANKGTLFLDEVGNLTAASQARLLRVLETGHVTPLGAKEGVDVDVRVVSATNRGVLESGDGFREDLLHRLSGFVLSPPPLRERKEDLGLLVKALLEDAGVREASCLPEVARALYLHPLTGNVRQLRNVLRRAAVGHPKLELESLDGLEAEVAARPSRPAPAPSGASTRKPANAPVRARGERPSREELIDALKASKGSAAAAARALATYPRQLYRWLEEEGLKPDEYRS